MSELCTIPQNKSCYKTIGIKKLPPGIITMDGMMVEKLKIIKSLEKFYLPGKHGISTAFTNKINREPDKLSTGCLNSDSSGSRYTKLSKT